ncbi:SLC13 family permease [Haladaptatus sp. DYSN1]|uniref:SLC13 family permease n=1 Tax=unclassified Haladaptatus TaxID=2622732 RepID=UPI0034E94A69
MLLLATQVGGDLPPLTVDMLVVFGIALLAFSLFVSERVPVDVTALIIMFVLIVLGSWTNITPEEGISGFSNVGTITVLAMFVLSAGITRTGAVQRLGTRMAAYAGTDERKQLLATLTVAGIPSGFINNTPIVAMLVPVVSDLAQKGRTSPSKLLIPLSYASMVGGMLTLIGTSTNLIASSVSARLIDHPFSMFEFTKLGVLVFLTGAIYLIFVGHRLIPERIKPAENYVTEYDLAPYLAEVVVNEASPLVGQRLRGGLRSTEFDFDVIQVIREGETFLEPLDSVRIRANDKLVLRANIDIVRRLVATKGLSLGSTNGSSDEALATDLGSQTLAELILPSWSGLLGQSLRSSTFRQRYDANVLAIRRGGELLQQRLNRIRLRSGDTLLIQATEESLDKLSNDRDIIVVSQAPQREFLESKTSLAIGIVVSVVVLAALGVLDILVAAIGGVIAMVLGGILRPHEIYDAVDWDVIFLLAGVIPLGMAFEQTGAATLLGGLVALSGNVLPLIGVLWVFYVVTALMTALLSNTASVVLMIPVAVSTAAQVGANPFAFVLAVTFAASADFMTPIGYQTNLLVYGPGGYRFTDYFRVGAPLQVLLSLVTVLGIAFFWGL